MNRIDFPINGINGRYFVDGDTGEVYSLVNRKQPGVPYKLKPAPAGGYGLLGKGHWYTTSITQKYINTLIAQHNHNKKSVKSIQPAVVDNKYMLIVDDILKSGVYSFGELQEAIEVLIDEGWDSDDIMIVIDSGIEISVETKTVISLNR